MIQLVFMTCLFSDPEKCRERELIFADMSLMACMMSAQPVLADWVNSHPGWQIQSWRCGMVRSAGSQA